MHLTVRKLPDELSAALNREKRRRGSSLNQTVIDLLEQSLALKGRRTNGIRQLAGTWTAAQHQKFIENTRALEQIDQDFWK